MNVWVASYQDGLYKYDGTNWTFYNTGNSGIASNYCPEIEIAPNGEIWIGHGNPLGQPNPPGISIFDGNSWQMLSSQNSGLPYDNINDLEFDASGNVWIACTQSYIGWLWAQNPGALARFDGNTWTSYTDQNSGIPAPTVSALQVARNGDLWV